MWIIPAELDDYPIVWDVNVPAHGITTGLV